MSGLGTSVPNGVVPLLAFWSLLFTKGTIVPINAFPFRVAVTFMLARGTLVPNYLRSFSC